MAKAKKKAPSPVKKLRTTVKEVNKLGAYVEPRINKILIGLAFLGCGVAAAYGGWQLVRYLL